LNTIRNFFPITNECIYLNHAGTGPMTKFAEKAIQECITVYKKQAEFDIDTYFNKLNQARENIAELICAETEEITFTHNTSEGIYISLINIPLKEGENIIVMEEVFPAVRYVIEHNLLEIEKRYVNFCGRDPVDVIKRNLDNKTRAVVIDYVQFLTGEMIALKNLNKFLKEKRIYLIVDGIQAIGAINFSVKEIDIDFLSCGAGKWLFGPCGTGFLYVNKRNFQSLKRLHTGWLGAPWKNFENFENLPPLFGDARMFEMGTRNVIGITALAENCRMLKNWGMEKVEEKILKLKRKLHNKFNELGFEIVTPEREPQSGIITIKPNQPERLYKFLKKNRIIVSLRNNCLRFSPHFYNTEEEIEEVFDCLMKNKSIL